MYDDNRSGYESHRAFERFQATGETGPNTEWLTAFVGVLCIAVLVASAFLDLGVAGVLQWMIEHWGRALAIPAIFITGALFWLKRHVVQIYGILELFVASAVFLHFLNGYQRLPTVDASFLIAFVTGFLTPIYIAIRGLDNIFKWLDAREEEANKEKGTGPVAVH